MGRKLFHFVSGRDVLCELRFPRQSYLCLKFGRKPFRKQSEIVQHLSSQIRWNDDGKDFHHQTERKFLNFIIDVAFGRVVNIKNSARISDDQRIVGNIFCKVNVGRN